MQRLVLLLWLLPSCVVLHSAQLGEIDNRRQYKKKRFVLEVSELGVNVKNTARLASRSVGDGAHKLGQIIALFQFGPKTGNPVYDEDYARNLFYQIRKICPSGRVTGLRSVRESRSFHVLSGEIVRVAGYCLTPRKS